MIPGRDRLVKGTDRVDQENRVDQEKGRRPMDLIEAIRGRRMVRSFAEDPLEPGLVEGLVSEALRAPSAGNTHGVAWLVLDGPDTSLYWEHTTTAEWRESSPRFSSLARAPVVALSLCSPECYVERYGEPDKLGSGLGPLSVGEGGEAAWPVPYWFGDAAFSTMVLLLGVVNAGLGAAFLGSFRGEVELLASCGVPEGWRLFGAVVIGRPDGRDTPSPSLGRRPAPGAGALHRSRWGSGPR
jgi:nitroreductase